MKRVISQPRGEQKAPEDIQWEEKYGAEQDRVFDSLEQFNLT